MKKNHKIAISIIILLLAGAAFWYVQRYQPTTGSRPPVSIGSTHSIVLTKEGFEPNEITISQGDRVVFTTTSERDFWPASDLHPTHQIYPEFDPKQPIAKDKSWSFVFNKPGQWKYHDHLFSTRRGIINVVSAETSQLPTTDCSESNQSTECWNVQISSVLKKDGLDEAFSLLANLYATKPAFASTCHDNAHTLGIAAYELFANGQEINLSPKTAYCGYGFYHGFMETLLQTSGNVQEAKDFCAYAGKKLSGETSDAEGACYHGIGHGAVDGADPTAWGNVEKMMESGIKMCQLIAGDDTSEFGKLYRCVSGAFNAIEILSTDPKYKLPALVKDPFQICLNQPTNFLEACYTNMLPAVLRLTSNDFTKSAKIIQNIPSHASLAVRSQVMLSLFHEWIRINLNQPGYGVSEAVKLCRSLNSDMRLPCLEGLSGGHMKYGQPQKEYEKGLAFCASSLLQKDESNSCYAFILPRLRVWYSPEKTQEICATQPQEQKKLCGL